MTRSPSSRLRKSSTLKRAPSNRLSNSTTASPRNRSMRCCSASLDSALRTDHCCSNFWRIIFEDILMIDQNGMKELLGKVDRKLLTTALKGTSEQLRDHFLKAMSQRGADMLREDMDALGPVKLRDVEAAQQEIIAVIRQLEADGVLSLKGAAPGEQYVS